MGISSGIIGTLGDMLIQKLEKRGSQKKMDTRRALVFFLVATFYIGPFIHMWFAFLNKIAFPSHWGKVLTTVVMTAIDQSAGALMVTVGFFYAFELAQYIVPNNHSDAKVSGRSWITNANDSMKDSLKKTLIGNWKFWPAVNFVNFLIIPYEYQVLFSNLAAIFWNMFLSQVANAGKNI